MLVMLAEEIFQTNTSNSLTVVQMCVSVQFTKTQIDCTELTLHMVSASAYLMTPPKYQ